ncbi:Hypothetical predicted protein [Octopus vulgaris]|uniref:Uncharacterized protein n=1 Tax=Octopus vulgaris TaxID=6645 RepID=A0AA36AIW7_OCTVU|nr:Hypothetical predicted protein [Octopus vulgaris]
MIPKTPSPIVEAVATTIKTAANVSGFEIPDLYFGRQPIKINVAKVKPSTIPSSTTIRTISTNVVVTISNTQQQNVKKQTKR